MAYSLLDEVNKVLRDLSLPIVTNAQLDTHEAKIVIDRLNRVREDLMLTKWNFNTEARTLTPTATGEILLSDILQFRHHNRLDNPYRNIDGKLYNTKDNSFKFDSSVTLECAIDIPIEQSPIWFINLVTAQATLELLSVLGGNVEDKVATVNANYLKKRAIALQSDINEQRLNYVKDTLRHGTQGIFSTCRSQRFSL